MMCSVTPPPRWGISITMESGSSCGRKDSVKQMISGLLAAALIERSVRLERRPQMFEVHTVS